LDKLVKETFYDSHENYGREKITVSLRNKGYDVTEKQVRMSMKRLKIQCKYKKISKKRYDPKTMDDIPDLLNGAFISFIKNSKYSTDTSYFKTPNGFVYICSLIDLYDNYLYGLKVSTHNDTSLILSSYKTIENISIENAIIHSDHGSAHLSNETRQ
jgi:transposase InsO family protein